MSQLFGFLFQASRTKGFFFYLNMSERATLQSCKQRFWSKVTVRSSNECWEWQASLSRTGKYGQFTWNKQSWKAHRMAYFLHYGLIVKSLLVLHSCDNRICVNPNHLRQGTHQDNSNDAVSRNRTARNKNGGKRGTAHHNAKLTENDVIQIRQMISTQK